MFPSAGFICLFHLSRKEKVHECSVSHAVCLLWFLSVSWNGGGGGRGGGVLGKGGGGA